MSFSSRLSFVILAFAVGLISQGHAGESAAKVKEDPDKIRNDMRWWVERQIETVNSLKKKDTDCFLCGLATAGDATPKTCEKNYRNFYSQKVTENGTSWKNEADGRAYIDAHVVFGYSDFGDEVQDSYAREALVNELKMPCKYVPGISACGFKKIDPDDDDLYYKDVDGPTGPITLRIDIKNSSATNSEAQNRKLGPDGKVATLSPAQAIKTEAAENSWFGGLGGEAALNIYVGHNRGGGGPSMRPPDISPRTRETDYETYRANRVSINQAVEILKGNTAHPPAIVAVFACYSEGYESKAFRAASPKTAFLFSDASAQESNLAHAFALIDNVLALRCEAEVMESFNSLTKLPYDNIGLIHVHGLFP